MLVKNVIAFRSNMKIS